jgi:hypothetical protein
MPPDFTFTMPEMPRDSSAAGTSTYTAREDPVPEPSPEEVRLKRLAFFNKNSDRPEPEGLDDASTKSSSRQTQAHHNENFSVGMYFVPCIKGIFVCETSYPKCFLPILIK